MIDRDYEISLINLDFGTIKSNVCQECYGYTDPDRYSCCCELTEQIRQTLAQFCPACAGENCDHNHWISSVEYEYELTDGIIIEQMEVITYNNARLIFYCK